MNIAYLLIGGNIGDRLHYLQLAVEAIKKECGAVVSCSPVYQTAAWGNQNQNSFLNQALEVHTTLSANELLDNLLHIEGRLGRVRDQKYDPRIIDIDILLFNDDVVDTRNLKIPHPELPNRRFALQCLTDIAAQKIHPVRGKRIKDLLAMCADTLSVEKFN